MIRFLMRVVITRHIAEDMSYTWASGYVLLDMILLSMVGIYGQLNLAGERA